VTLTIPWSGDALTMCHRPCDLSSYWLKAHIREMSTPPKLTIGQAILYLYHWLI